MSAFNDEEEKKMSHYVESETSKSEASTYDSNTTLEKTKQFKKQFEMLLNEVE